MQQNGRCYVRNPKPVKESIEAVLHHQHRPSQWLDCRRVFRWTLAPIPKVKDMKRVLTESETSKLVSFLKSNGAMSDSDIRPILQKLTTATHCHHPDCRSSSSTPTFSVMVSEDREETYCPAHATEIVYKLEGLVTVTCPRCNCVFGYDP